MADEEEIQDLRRRLEELQSINEDLLTVNAELKSKLASISVAHSDLQSLTTATDIGALFLDTDLRIKMFTPPVAELFNITRADIGRAITDFRHSLEYEGLETPRLHFTVRFRSALTLGFLRLSGAASLLPVSRRRIVRASPDKSKIPRAESRPARKSVR